MANEFDATTATPLPKTCGAGSLRKEKELYIMNISGSYTEMGEQMGTLARGILDDYVISYYRNIPELLIEHSVINNISRVLPPRIANLIYSLFVRLNQAALGDELKGFMKGYCEALGVSYKKGIDAMFFADILHYMAGKAFTPMAMPGCSGFFARGAATKDGKMLLGRNFDFFGRGVWNTNQTLTIMRPAGGYAYMWVGTLGIPFGGFGINEAGISFCPFTNFNRDLLLKGRPLFPMCMEIMETASNLDEVVEIIGKEPRIAGLSFLVSDNRACDSRVVGFSANHMEILRPEEDYLIRTNHYRTDAMRSFEVAPRGWHRHSYARYIELDRLIKENYGNITPSHAVSFMSSVNDPFEDRKRIVGDLVAATNNCMSIVMSPEDDALYIAHGDFPVCHADTFYGYSLKALFAGEESASIGDLPGGRQLDENERKALNYYEDAEMALNEHGDPAMAVYYLRRGAELVPDEPVFHRMAGLILLKMGRYADARSHLEIDAAPDYKDQRVKAQSLLWAARANDLCGDRGRALDYYRKAMLYDDLEIKPAAIRGSNKPYSKFDILNLSAEFTTGGPIIKY